MRIGQLIKPSFFSSGVWSGLIKLRTKKRKLREPGVSYSDILERSDRLLDSKKLFLNENFSIDTLAREVGTNRTYLSRSIKHCRQENFAGYINRIKIEHAKRLINERTEGICRKRQSKQPLDLEDIAIASGFGSRRSFVRCFRQIEGITPTQFKNHMKITRHPPSPPRGGGWL
ncbi:MAG: helix-turn-helix domain-containing protein [Bacteroidales bacterium]